MQANNLKAMLQTLGIRVKEYRIDSELTQKELAEKAGVSVHSIHNIESGKDVQLSIFLKVLRALELVDNVEMLIPDMSVRPSKYLEKNNHRKRYKKSKKETENTFQWGDEK